MLIFIILNIQQPQQPLAGGSLCAHSHSRASAIVCSAVHRGVCGEQRHFGGHQVYTEAAGASCSHGVAVQHWVRRRSADSSVMLFDLTAYVHVTPLLCPHPACGGRLSMWLWPRRMQRPCRPFDRDAGTSRYRTSSTGCWRPRSLGRSENIIGCVRLYAIELLQ